MFYEIEKLQKLNRESIDIESYLLRQIPSSFVNFLDIKPLIVDSIITHVINQDEEIVTIDLKDQNIANSIKRYIEIADQIYNMHIFLEEPKYRIVGSFIEKFLYAQNLFQNLRVLIYRSSVGVLQFEKILNEKERDLLGTNQLQPTDYPILEIFIPDSLFMDEYGNLDESITIENERKSGKIRTTLSSLGYKDFKNILLFRFKNYSNFTFLAIADEALADLLCEIASKNIHRLFAISTYGYILNGLDVDNAFARTRNEFGKVANEYLTTGDSTNDRYKIAQNIFEECTGIFESFNDYKKENHHKISLEIIRLSMNILKEGTHLPKRYYKLKFRKAKEIEKVYKDVEDIMEAHLIDRMDENSIDSDLYIITLTPESKKELNFVASRGIENSDKVNSIIKTYITANTK